MEKKRKLIVSTAVPKLGKNPSRSSGRFLKVSKRIIRGTSTHYIS